VTRTRSALLPVLGPVLALGLLVLGGTWLASCGPAGFQDEALVNGVRILATRSDHPYAKPGDTVTLTVLAADGRTNQPEPMVVYWFPVSFAAPLTLPLPKKDFVCEDPKDDAYYACFAALSSALGASDGGVSASDGGGGSPKLGISPGMDLSPLLPQGPTLAVPIAKDIIQRHPPVMGTDAYGLAIVFNMACAGHPELLPVDPNNLSFNQLPIGCFDKTGKQLDSDSYVVGYGTIYVYDTLTNANPVISHLVYKGQDLSAGSFVGDSGTGDAGSLGDAGIVVPTCTLAKSSDCPTYPFDIVVPDASWEVDPQDLSASGQPLHEQIWVDYYWTAGSFSDDSRLVFDPTMGLVGGTAVSLTAPSSATAATFWAVVHDNRGGVSWDIVPYTVR
jgi:hypothetical protein